MPQNAALLLLYKLKPGGFEPLQPSAGDMKGQKGALHSGCIFGVHRGLDFLDIGVHFRFWVHPSLDSQDDK